MMSEKDKYSRFLPDWVVVEDEDAWVVEAVDEVVGLSVVDVVDAWVDVVLVVVDVGQSSLKQAAYLW